MLDALVLILTLIIFAMVVVVVSRSVIRKQSIFGKPPVPVFYFLLAKILVIVNLVFLLLRGLRIEVPVIFEPAVSIDWIALVVLVTGIIILLTSAIQLNYDLIFGLSSSDKHKLHTNGIYSLSRHPFYLGFIFILFSSCLLTPNLLNIAAFLGAWLIHHRIMVREEEFLISQYGQEYIQYAKKVRRYINLF
jgi:protein-S-isoprenylcysteine O-methyltransferase Ste14